MQREKTRLGRACLLPAILPATAEENSPRITMGNGGANWLTLEGASAGEHR
jgi:hypothetical protein